MIKKVFAGHSCISNFVLSFLPRVVLDEILNLIKSVSEGFLTYSCYFKLFHEISQQFFNPDLDDLIVNF